MEKWQKLLQAKVKCQIETFSVKPVTDKLARGEF